MLNNNNTSVDNSLNIPTICWFASRFVRDGLDDSFSLNHPSKCSMSTLPNNIHHNTVSDVVKRGCVTMYTTHCQLEQTAAATTPSVHPLR